MFSFLFVLDFPLLAWNDEEQWWEPGTTRSRRRGRRTSPCWTDPGAARAQHYDLVCNGQEIGSGSIRIHEREVQEKIFSFFRLSPDQIEERFGHLLSAFEYGAPPMRGFGHGLDRIVALLAGERDIREVITFPKTKSASDPMTGAPLPAAEDQLKLRTCSTSAWRKRRRLREAVSLRGRRTLWSAVANGPAA